MRSRAKAHQRSSALQLSRRLSPVLPAFAAALTVGLARVTGVPQILLTAAALGLCAFIVLFRLSAGLGMKICLCLAGFFAGAPIRFGLLEVSDVFLLLGVALLVLRPPVERGAARMPVTPLLVGLSLISVGGFIGNFFEPAEAHFTHIGGYHGSPLWILPAPVADIVRFTLSTLGLVLFVRAWRPRWLDVRAILVAFGGGIVFNSLWGLLIAGSVDGRVQSLSPHPVFFGMSSAFGAVVGLGLMASPERRTRAFGLAVCAAGVTGVLISGTRSAVLVAGSGAVIFYLGGRSLRRVAAMTLVLTLALGLGVVGGDRLFAGTSAVRRLGGGDYATVANEGRAQAREEAYALIRTHRLTGAGFRFLAPPHSLVLGVLAAAGLIGLAGLLMVVGSLVAQLLSRTRHDPLATAVIAGALGVYAAAWVVNQPWDRWLWLPLALVVGGVFPTAAGAETEAPAAGEWRSDVSSRVA
jgi:hypothetical protein